MKVFSRPGVWKAFALACFLAIPALWLMACSAMPVLRGDLEDVQTDQQDQLRAAERGDMIRTIVSGVLALVGSAAYARSRVLRYDSAPFEGQVDGRKVSASEDEIVKVVEAGRKSGIV